MTLLSKTRRLNRMLQKAAGNAVSFMEMAEVLKDTISASVYVVSRKGKILGYAMTDEGQGESFRRMVSEERRFPPEFNLVLMKVEETTTHPGEENLYQVYAEKAHAFVEQAYVTVIPIVGGTERHGTLMLTRGQPFVDDDLILAEYGSTIVGMEILRQHAEEVEQEARSKAAVAVAVNSLSYSEMEAVEHIFEELDGLEGLLVASKIADRVGITRSVIVNALRKLESAGVIETRSLGMKGTYIKILNEQLIQEISKPKPPV
ncbi:GTP-sensing pleiotropic transcriptional regulator CodY [Paenibacillus thermoaerophilus]|uniref:Global transcriptional regulator CodY n=1 Tax=Paenibacillus thermoaerophilus TaxID=1215385 RepID=A0ABW2V0P1_9BACL|nr:GTP-sensing pleiotropic transcriptional regulator CodY [Paenibacillus thermoaerophilus]TMV13789.1 GTP-sensing pleiotropic transcriptional regulator CodY [Paenibacillus thermoaerophilus]